MLATREGRRWPKGPQNILHDAAIRGSIDVILSVLSRGSIDINQGDPLCYSPLMLAVRSGHCTVVRVLLKKGANVSIEADNGITALHVSAMGGHLAITKMLMEAGADLEAADLTGSTPLRSAAVYGCWEVMRLLIAAGANPDSRTPSGETPLHAAAHAGHVQAVRELLRAKANPLLMKTFFDSRTVRYVVPLDFASQEGHSDVVRELIRQVGIEGCGGPTSGETSLQIAARGRHMDVLGMLMDAGVAVTGPVLVPAARTGHEELVKFLLQRQEGKATSVCVNSCDADGLTPLLASILSGSPRVARMLIDAGADTTSFVRVTCPTGETAFHDTPIAFTCYTRIRMVVQQRVTDENLHRLEAINHMLLQVDAVHAVSWLWPNDIPAMAHAANDSRWTKATTSSLTVMLPIWRRRASNRGVVLAALHRYSRKL